MKPISLEKFISDAAEQNDRQLFNAYYSDICAEYRHRNDAYSLIAQINQLIKSVQKHRGYTMGLLSGDDSYRERFDALQCALQRRLQIIELFSSHTGSLVSEADRSNLHFCWQTIANNWQEDNYNESLELHSHFVSQLLSMMFKIANDLAKPLLDAADKEVIPPSVLDQMCEYPHSLAKVELLNFVGKFLPENIEQIGKLRALSTHMAQDGNRSDSDLRKLRFLVDTVRTQINMSRNMGARLQEFCSGYHVGLNSLFDTEMKLGLLLSQIENGILAAAAGSDLDARELFVKATQVIDAYWIVVNKGFELMRQWHEQEFEFWLAAN